jgi:hypothetical protein
LFVSKYRQALPWRNKGADKQASQKLQVDMLPSYGHMLQSQGGTLRLRGCLLCISLTAELQEITLLLQVGIAL